MARKRIHEFAKEWEVESRQIIAALTAMNVRGKKSQSTLSEQEADEVRQALGLSATPALALGEEKVVAARVVTELDQQKDHVVAAREEVRENRIRPNVIRRRKRVEVLSDPDPAVDAAEAVPSAFAAPAVDDPPPTFTAPAFDLPPPEPVFIPEPPPIPEPEPEPMLPELPAAEAALPTPPEENGAVPVLEARQSSDAKTDVSPLPTRDVRAEPAFTPERRADRTPAPRADTGRTAPSSAPDAPPSGRVLGRIDLDKLAPPAVGRRAGLNRSPAGAPQPGPGSREPGSPAAAPGGRKRGKKRKVIFNADAAELRDREVHVPRSPKKKRILPGKEQRQTAITVPKASKRVVRISEVVSVGDLARSLGVKSGEVIKKLMDLGIMATINQTLDHDTASLVAADFEYTVENVAFDAESVLEDALEAVEDRGTRAPRPPVVTIMGHVDHGKTSLLDKIRQTNVTDHEAGGITQHIGAYNVPVDGRSVTFLDTPGHEAFTSMRARGAKATDIVTLVVAADDGVMPQTVEAINHARAAEVPIIVAVNKMDKVGADLDRVKRDLMTHGLIAEDMGGETIFAPVSAVTGDGIAHLLEMLILQADIMELRANADKFARGVIVEAQLDRGRGAVATVLVQEGELKVGDPFVCGTEYGRIRAMVDSRNRKVDAATPSMPVEILGLTGVPEAGDPFTALSDEAKARKVAEHRKEKRRETELTKSSRTSLEDFYQQQTGDTKELRVIIKADVQGSAEAVQDALTRLSTDEVKLTVLHASVGGVSESDVLLASASQGIIIGFNIRPEGKATRLADREGIDVRLYTIIYDVIADVRAALEGLLAPTYKENALGRAEVREVFTVSKIGQVAGCMVVEGTVARGVRVRVVRDHAVVHDGRLATLRRFKDDVREVAAGTECGASLEHFQDVKVGDVLEAYELEEVARRLEPGS